MKNKKQRKQCYNCKHHGTPFKIAGGMTEMYCEHPDNFKSFEENTDIDPRDFIMSWYSSCEKHEPKHENHSSPTLTTHHNSGQANEDSE